MTPTLSSKSVATLNLLYFTRSIMPYLNRFFASMVISQLVLANKECFNFPKALDFLKDFLLCADSKQLYKWASVQYGYWWNDMLPYMKPLYTCSKWRSLSEDDISMRCLGVVVLGLQVILEGERERQVLVKQGLLEYLTCLPWHMPKGSMAHQRAKSLVDMVGSHIVLQPPSLNVIVKAKLAVTCLGLEKVLKSDSRQIVEELLL